MYTGPYDPGVYFNFADFKEGTFTAERRGRIRQAVPMGFTLFHSPERLEHLWPAFWILYTSVGLDPAWMGGDDPLELVTRAESLFIEMLSNEPNTAHYARNGLTEERYSWNLIFMDIVPTQHAREAFINIFGSDVVNRLGSKLIARELGLSNWDLITSTFGGGYMSVYQPSSRAADRLRNAMPQFAISEMDAEDAEDSGSPWVAAGGDVSALRARMATGQGGDMAELYTTATEAAAAMKGAGGPDATWGQDEAFAGSVGKVSYGDKDGLSLDDFSETAKLLADEINDKTDKEQKEKDDKEKEQKEKEQKEKEKYDKEKEKQDQEKEETPTIVGVEYGLFDDKDYQTNKPKIPKELVENIKSLDDLVKDCNDSMKKFRAIGLRLDEMLTYAKEALASTKSAYATLKATRAGKPGFQDVERILTDMVKAFKKEILVYQAQIDLVHKKTAKHADFLAGCKQPETEKISGKPPAPEEPEETIRTMNGDEITDPITGEIINFDQFLARYSVNNPAHNQTIVTTLSKSSFTITLKEKFEFCKDEEFEVSFFEIDENPASEIPNYDESEVLKELYFRASNSDNSSLRLDDRFNVVFDALIPEEHMVYDIEEECKTNTTIWSRSTMEDSSLSIRDAYNDKQFVIPALLATSASTSAYTSSNVARRRANNDGVNLLESIESVKKTKDANDMQSMAKSAAKLATKLTDSGKDYK